MSEGNVLRCWRALAFLFLLIQTTTTAAAGERIVVMLDAPVSSRHAPLVIAWQKEYFAKAGLDVDLIAPTAEEDTTQLVLSGKADLALTTQPHLHLAAAEGQPLIRIATLVSLPLTSLAVLKDGPIKNIADLKGHRIGFPIHDDGHVWLGTMLEKHGLSSNSVYLVNVGDDPETALAQHKVDAVIGVSRIEDSIRMELEGRALTHFFPEDNGVPSYDESILVANSRKLDTLKLRRFVDALERAVQFIVNYPDDAWKLFVSQQKELDDKKNRRAWKQTIARLDLRPAALDRARYVRFAMFLRQRGLIKESVPVDTYAIELPADPRYR